MNIDLFFKHTHTNKTRGKLSVKIIAISAQKWIEKQTIDGNNWDIQRFIRRNKNDKKKMKKQNEREWSRKCRIVLLKLGEIIT